MSFIWLCSFWSLSRTLGSNGYRISVCVVLSNETGGYIVLNYSMYNRLYIWIIHKEIYNFMQAKDILLLLCQYRVRWWHSSLCRQGTNSFARDYVKKLKVVNLLSEVVFRYCASVSLFLCLRTIWNTNTRELQWCYDKETPSALLPLCVGNPPVYGDSSHQGAVMQGHHVFFVIDLKSCWKNNRVADYLKCHDADMMSL